jgi:hypothetical protein
MMVGHDHDCGAVGTETVTGAELLQGTDCSVTLSTTNPI